MLSAVGETTLKHGKTNRYRGCLCGFPPASLFWILKSIRLLVVLAGAELLGQSLTYCCRGQDRLQQGEIDRQRLESLNRLTSNDRLHDQPVQHAEPGSEATFDPRGRGLGWVRDQPEAAMLAI